MPLDEPEHCRKPAFMFAGANAAALNQPRLQATFGGPFRIARTPRHDAQLRGEFPGQGHQRESINDPPHLGIRTPGQMAARPPWCDEWSRSVSIMTVLLP